MIFTIILVYDGRSYVTQSIAMKAESALAYGVGWAGGAMGLKTVTEAFDGAEVRPRQIDEARNVLKASKRVGGKWATFYLVPTIDDLPNIDDYD